MCGGRKLKPWLQRVDCRCAWRACLVFFQWGTTGRNGRDRDHPSCGREIARSESIQCLDVVHSSATAAHDMAMSTGTNTIAMVIAVCSRRGGSGVGYPSCHTGFRRRRWSWWALFRTQPWREVNSGNGPWPSSRRAAYVHCSDRGLERVFPLAGGFPPMRRRRSVEGIRDLCAVALPCRIGRCVRLVEGGLDSTAQYSTAPASTGPSTLPKHV